MLDHWDVILRAYQVYRLSVCVIQVDFRLLYMTAVNLQCGAVGGVTLCVLLGVGAPAALAGSSGLCSVG